MAYASWLMLVFNAHFRPWSNSNPLPPTWIATVIVFLSFSQQHHNIDITNRKRQIQRFAWWIGSQGTNPRMLAACFCYQSTSLCDYVVILSINQLANQLIEQLLIKFHAMPWNVRPRDLVKGGMQGRNSDVERWLPQGRKQNPETQKCAERPMAKSEARESQP